MIGDFDFGAWQAAFDARLAAHRERVLAALSAGRSVVEHMGQVDSVWPKIDAPVFIAPYNTDPVYLAEHLMNRHRGFGFDHTIDGVRYHLGEAGARP